MYLPLLLALALLASACAFFDKYKDDGCVVHERFSCPLDLDACLCYPGYVGKWCEDSDWGRWRESYIDVWVRNPRLGMQLYCKYFSGMRPSAIEEVVSHRARMATDYPDANTPMTGYFYLKECEGEACEPQML